MSDLISLPRSVVEQLVDPIEHAYIGYSYLSEDEPECLYCLAEHKRPYRPATATDDGFDHEPSCPVRLAQEALKEQA